MDDQIKYIKLLINFSVNWLPTIIFTLIVLIAFLIGLKKGLRKSIIDFLSKLVIGILCLSMFFVSVKIPIADAFFLRIVNSIFGEGFIQNVLGADSNCATIKEIIIDIMPKLLGNNDLMYSIISDNEEYLLTLIEVVYRLIYGVIYIVIYYILIILFDIIFAIVGSTATYSKKKNRQFALGKADSKYKHNPLAGGLIGLFRGIISGLISLSIVGSLFYVIAGDGKNEVEDISVDNQIVDVGYYGYQVIEGYGNNGIYSYLNEIKDEQNMPYYLFASNLLLSGSFENKEDGTKSNIRIIDETSAYVSFATDTTNLLLKYGGKDLQQALNKDFTSGVYSIPSIISNVLINEGFQIEFEQLIEDFDSKTFYKNIVLSVINSMIDNINSTSELFNISMDDNLKDLLQILFTKGHLSTNIPSERKLLASGKTQGSGNLSYISLNKLLVKNDVKIIFKAVFDVLSEVANGETDTLKIASNMVDRVLDLSILQTDRAEEFNGLLTRVYTYFEHVYLVSGDKNDKYSDHEALYADTTINWGEELKTLINSTKNLLSIYDNVKDKYSDVTDIFDFINCIFDKDEPYYQDNINLIDNTIDLLASSKILGAVLQSRLVNYTITNAMATIYDGIYISEDINYSNTYDSNGNILSYGELYNLLNVVITLVKQDNVDLLETISNSSDFTSAIDSISSILYTKDDKGNNIVDYIASSTLVRSFFSAVLLSFSESNDSYIYIPTGALAVDSNNECVNLINQEEFELFIKNLPEIVDFIFPYFDGEKDIDLKEIISSDTLNKLLESKIVQGSVAKIIYNSFKSNSIIIIPSSLNDMENWISDDSKVGETEKLFNFITTSSIDINNILEGKLNPAELLSCITSSDIDLILDSGIMYYTISNFICENADLGGLDIIVPNISCDFLIKDTIDKLIEKDEIIKLLECVNWFDLNNESAFSILVKASSKREEIQSSPLLTATIAYNIANHNLFDGVLEVPTRYKEEATKEKLLLYSTSNIWSKEVYNLLEALDEFIGISKAKDTSELTSNDITKLSDSNIEFLGENSDLYGSSKTKLEVFFASGLFANYLTKKLDTIFEKNNLASEIVLARAKVDGMYPASELLGIIYGAKIFGFDSLHKLTAVNAKEKLSDKLLTLNDVIDDENHRFYGMSNLEVIYQSIIIDSFVSEIIDSTLAKTTNESTLETLQSIKSENELYEQKELAALVNCLKIDCFNISNISSSQASIANSFFNLNDEEIETIFKSKILAIVISDIIDSSISSLVDEEIIKASKRRISAENFHLIYSFTELINIRNAFCELGINNLSNIKDNISFKAIYTLNETSNLDANSTKLQVIFKSNIVGGIITKLVDNVIGKGNIICSHSKAYKDDIHIYKESEISSLVSLIGNDISKFKIDSTDDLNKIKQLIYNSKGETSSYIMLATLSNQILTSSLVVLDSDMDGNYIKATTLSALLEVFINLDLLNGNSFDSFNMSTLKISKDSIACMLASSIMHSTISKSIVSISTSDNEIYLPVSKISKLYDRNKSQVYQIDKKEIENLFTGLISLNGDNVAINEIEFTKFASFDTLTDKDKLQIYLNSEIIRFKIDSTLKSLNIGFINFGEDYKANYIKGSKVKYVSLYSYVETSYLVGSKDEIILFIDHIKETISSY